MQGGGDDPLAGFLKEIEAVHQEFVPPPSKAALVPTPAGAAAVVSSSNSHQQQQQQPTTTLQLEASLPQPEDLHHLIEHLKQQQQQQQQQQGGDPPMGVTPPMPPTSYPAATRPLTLPPPPAGFRASTLTTTLTTSAAAPPLVAQSNKPPVVAAFAPPTVVVARPPPATTSSQPYSTITLGGVTLPPRPKLPYRPSSSGSSDNANKKFFREGAGKVWEDPTLQEWPDDDYRIFVGNLGNDVNVDSLSKAFSSYPSFQKAKVIRDKKSSKTRGFGFVSFADAQDMLRALSDMQGKYIGARPVMLRASNWRERQCADSGYASSVLKDAKATGFATKRKKRYHTTYDPYAKKHH